MQCPINEFISHYVFIVVKYEGLLGSSVGYAVDKILSAVHVSAYLCYSYI